MRGALSMFSHLSFWLAAQTLWLAMAISYNLIGIYRVSQDGRALVGESDQPVRALVGLAVFAFPILAGYLNWDTVYRFSMPFVLLLLVVVGFWRHIEAAKSPEGMNAYASSAAWWWAVGINGYGTVVFAIGLFVAWRVYLQQ